MLKYCSVCGNEFNAAKGKVCAKCRYNKRKLELANSSIDTNKLYQCLDCSQLKTYENFYPSKIKSNGLSSRCKHCESVKYKERKDSETYKLLRNKYRANRTEDHREKARLKVRDWKSKNKFKVLAQCARRRASKLRATPSWADNSKIVEIYKRSQELTISTGIIHHVDHIVPLISELVCGLHCENNLRVIVGKENLSKGNRYWDDMPD